jgi:hypothetical protein
MHPLTQRHRAQQLLIRKDTAAKVARLWPALDFKALDASYPALASRLATLVQANRRTSAGVAAQYLRTFRREAGVRGNPRIVIPKPVPAEQLAISLRVSSLIAVKNATAAGVASDVAMGNALTLTKGAMTRLVLDAGRETVRATTIAEKAGWVRVGNGECDWCQQYLDGEIHYAEGYDFAAHDNCGCTAEPAY